MPFKIDENGAIVTQEVNGQKLPIFVHTDGKEAPFDGDSILHSIRSRAEQSQRVEAENKEFREKLKAFEGIEDADAARKALETLKNIDEGKLIQAGKVEEIKSAAAKAAQEQVAAASKAHAEELARTKQDLEKITGELYAEKIGGAFTRSKLIAEKFAIPADLVQARFGQQFKIEDGKVVAYDQASNKIFSRTKPGEVADFEEALETLVDQYPYRDHILKASGANGGGAPAGNGGNPGKKTLNRAAFDQLDPAEKVAHVRSGGAVID
ncbi:DUF6651 domain-containing protein [Azotobacter vinelandii]|uniref:DUF6651 domain-containing protein n=1 Tax=Azotobacter vinelandii TaxID=354 RepID=UPI00266500BF|nr:DUF6651 domain-containing protein [Azotobacter vinelandii]WKN20819.1 hypothetical protein AVAEIV_003844 [Azotobacter vinelandii]